MAVGRGVVGGGAVVAEAMGTDLDYGARPACSVASANGEGLEDVLRLGSVVMAMNMVSRDSRVAVVCDHMKEHFVRGKTYKWDFSGLLSVASEKALPSTAELSPPSSSSSSSDSHFKAKSAWRKGLGLKYVLRDDIQLGIDLLNPGIPNTLEFRQPPGSCSAEDAFKWVVLAVAFFSGAVKPEVVGWTKPWGVVLKLGAKDLGWEHLGGLEKLLGAKP